MEFKKKIDHEFGIVFGDGNFFKASRYIGANNFIFCIDQVG